jgi:hypothetical protein
MRIELTLKNYRCFPDSKPVRFVIQKGFTALLGVNNSGKSSLLRFFYEFRSLFRLLSSANGNLQNAFEGVPQGLSGLESVQDQSEIYCNNNDRDLQIELQFLDCPRADQIGERICKIHLTVSRTGSWTCKFYGDSLDHKLEFSHPRLTTENAVQGGGSPFSLVNLFDAARLLSETVYVGPFRNLINIGTASPYFDINAGQSFISTWRVWQTGAQKAHSKAVLELSEDIRTIFGYDSLQINASHDETTLQLIINGKPFMLREVGNGIAQFILVLGNAAIKRPAFVLIDEPELSLHPSLQSYFLTAFAKYVREGVIFATHSYGLARSAADYRYSFRRIVEGESEVRVLEETPRLSEFLGELSFSGCQDVGFQKILLIEGPTEYKTIQQFLAKYKKDHLVVLLHLGGNSLINGKREDELREILRICDKVSALIDSEKDSESAPLGKARQDFRDTCNRIGISCHVLKYRAMENYFTEPAIKQVNPNLSALGKYSELPQGWSKIDNWRIAWHMTTDDIKGTDLGSFLESL